MRSIALLLLLPALSSCSLLNLPGKTLKSATRTLGLSQNDTLPPADPAMVALLTSR